MIYVMHYNPQKEEEKKADDWGEGKYNTPPLCSIHSTAWVFIYVFLIYDKKIWMCR